MSQAIFDYIIPDGEALAQSMPMWGPEATAHLTMLGGGRLRKHVARSGVVTLHLVCGSDWLLRTEEAIIEALEKIADRVFTGANQRSTVGAEGHAWIFYYPRKDLK